MHGLGTLTLLCILVYQLNSVAKTCCGREQRRGIAPGGKASSCGHLMPPENRRIEALRRALRCKRATLGVKADTAANEEDRMKITRRTFVGGAAGVAAAGLLPLRAFAQAKAPASPVTITVVDVAGNLALTQGMFQNYAKAKPEFVSSFSFTK